MTDLSSNRKKFRKQEFKLRAKKAAFNINKDKGYVPDDANHDEPLPPKYPFRHGYRPYGHARLDLFNEVSSPESNIDWRTVTDKTRALFRENPFAARLVHAKNSQIVGRNVSITANTDPKPPNCPSLQEIIDAFWKNKRTPRIYDMEVDLQVDGTSVYPVFEQPYTGYLTMAIMPYERVGDLIRELHDVRFVSHVVDVNADYVDNATVQLWHVINPSPTSKFPEPSRNVIPELEGVVPAGKCFLFRANRQQDYLWGWSSLYASSKWLEHLNDFVYDLFEYTYWMSSFFWDVKLDGANEADVRKFVAEQPPPARASIVAHNEKATWSANAPSFQASAFEEVSNTVIRFVSAVAYGIPPHVLGFPEGSNRATSDSQDTFLVRELAKEQSLVEERIRLMTDYAIACAYRARGVDPETLDIEYTVNLPIIDVGDLKILVQVLNAVAAFISTLKNAGYKLDKTIINSLLTTVTNRLGIQLREDQISELYNPNTLTPLDKPTDNPLANPLNSILPNTTYNDPELNDAVNPMSGFTIEPTPFGEELINEHQNDILEKHPDIRKSLEDMVTTFTQAKTTIKNKDLLKTL